MLKVASGRIVLMSVAVILLGSGMAVGQCCIAPTSESTRFIGVDPFLYPQAMFLQTITTSTAVTGRIIQEFASDTGDNACFWTGATSPPRVVGTRGGTWVVASDGTWGPDSIGWRNFSIDIIRRDGPPNGLRLTETSGCAFVIYQGLEIECIPQFFVYVTGNRLTETVYSDHVAVFREENIAPFNKACSGNINY